MKTNRSVLWVSVWVFVLLALCIIEGRLMAQNTGTILGTVKDQSGAVLPGASISIRNLETGTTRASVTGDRGEYRVPALSVGIYEVHVEMTGFQTGIRQGITLTVGREAVVDFSLNVGNVAEQVTVTGEAPLIETTSATVGGVVDQQQMRDIPLNARSFLELVPLQSGAVLSDTGGQSGVFGFSKKLAVVGTRYTSNSFLLDGSDINDSSGSSGSAAGTMAGVETVREFRVITNAYDAEYGRHTGGVISAITKSGTNDFHGSAFEFLRNDNLDAARWEDNALGGGEKPEFRRNQFGGSVGGPIVSDKTFFFGSYEGLREGLGQTSTFDVPNLETRQGRIPLSAANCTTNGGTVLGNGLCQLTVAPNTKPYLESYPLPNQPDRSDGTARFVEGNTQVTGQDYWTARGDHQISNSDSLFVRFTKDDADRATPNMNRLGTQFTANRLTTVEHTHIYSPALLGKTHLAFNRTNFSDIQDPRADRVFPLESFSDNTAALAGISITSPDVTDWGGTSLSPRTNVQNTWQFKEEAYYSLGRHSMKMGFQYERFQYNMRGDFHGAGDFSFGGFDEFLLGRPASANFVKPGSDSTRSWIQSLFGFFVHDDINVRPGFSLNLGLRYEFITVPAERHGRSATIRDLSSPHLNTVKPSETDIGPLFENPSLKNFAPRIGFAWDVFGSGKTSVRGGIGMFHDQVLSTYYVVPGNRVSPFFSVAALLRQTVVSDLGQEIDFPNSFFTQSAFITQASEGVRPQIDGIEFFMEQPAVYKWNLDIDQQIAPDTTLQTGYTGTRSTHLMRGNLQMNTSPSEFRDLGGQQRRFIIMNRTPDRDNPFFDRFRWRFNDGSANYHAFRLGVTRRFSRGFQLQSSYTYSRSTDDGSAFLGSGDFENDRQPYRTDHEFGLSSFDIRHSFNTNFVYDLPGANLGGAAGKVLGGWSVSSLLRLNTGNPNSVTASAPRLGSRRMIFVDGPSVELVPGGNLNPVKAQNPNNYIDVSQFCAPVTCLPRGTDGFFVGNVGVGTVIGPGVANIDFTLTKDTPIAMLGEAGALQFRWEMFNLFNRPNYSDPSTNLFGVTGTVNSGAGEITSTRLSSRQIQLALKLLF